MPNSVAQWKRILLFIDFFVVMSVELAVLFLLSLFGGWRLAAWVDTGRSALKLRKNFGGLPYNEVLALVKKRMGIKHNARNSASGEIGVPEAEGTLFPNERISKRDLAFYAFTANPRNRQGVWAILACLFLCALIYNGADWGILYLLIAALFLFGLCRLARGLMEVV